MVVGAAYNILRPETIESFMYLWRKTEKKKYRDWGWDIFQAFERQSRTPSGYVGLRDVRFSKLSFCRSKFFLCSTILTVFSPMSLLGLTPHLHQAFTVLSITKHASHLLVIFQWSICCNCWESKVWQRANPDDGHARAGQFRRKRWYDAEFLLSRNYEVLVPSVFTFISAPAWPMGVQHGGTPSSHHSSRWRTCQPWRCSRGRQHQNYSARCEG